MPNNGYATDDDVSGAFGNPLLALSSPNMQAVYEQARRQAMQNQMAGAQSIEDQFFAGKKPEPSALDKLLGLGGTERYQTWPERMVRSAVSAPHDAMNSTPANPVTTEQMIAPALDIANFAMGGSAPFTPKGAVGMAGTRLIAPAEKELAPAWHSAVENAVKTSKQETATPEQWVGMIKNHPGVKQEELSWMGLDDPKAFGTGKISKADMESYIDSHKVELKDVTKGARDPLTSAEKSQYDALKKRFDEKDFSLTADDAGKMAELEFKNKRMPDSSNPTKFHEYQLPGGENYREHLLTIPEKINSDWKAVSHPSGEGFAIKNSKNEYGLNPNGIGEAKFKTAKEAELSAKENYAEKQPDFQSSHWDEPNVLAHVRMNDRDIPGVGKTLHLEEIQSDWHQKGRKEGYANNTPADTTGMSATEYKEFGEPYWKVKDKNGDHFFSVPKLEGESAQQAIQKAALRKAELGNSQGVPDAPFKKSWPELALKRMIRHAAENGYDAVSWTPGEAQAARYDLSKQVNGIHWQPSPADKNATLVQINPTSGSALKLQVDNSGKVVASFPSSRTNQFEGKNLADVIGKEHAEKILNKTNGSLEGEGLKIGGEGMKAFYDKMLPEKANALAKKFGGKVEQAKIRGYGDILPEGGRVAPDRMHLLSAEQKASLKPVEQAIHLLRLNNAMKDTALQKGFPLFSGGHMLVPVGDDNASR